MKVLNTLLALHESTKNDNQRSGRVGLSKRMFVRTYEINRIGKNYDEINRNDVGTEMILKSYLARKVYINEKYKSGKYYIDEYYQNEVRFTNGLWKIFCTEVFDEYLPELPVPETYKELDNLFKNDSIHLRFSLHKTVKEAVIHNQLFSDKHYCQSMKSFDLFCSLPGIPGWTALQHGAILADGRVEAPQRLIQTSLGMYKLEHLGCDEPYKNFWKERATQSLNKALVILKKSYIVKFRNAAAYDEKFLPEKFKSVKNYDWKKGT